MLILRSLVFNVLFYLNLALWLVFAAFPSLLLPRRYLIWIAVTWGRSALWLMRVTTGTRYEIAGIENIPQGGLMVAAKHQSFWETFALVTLFPDPVFILKRELTWIPFFGWCLTKLRMIPVDRGGKARALAHVTRRAKVELTQNGRQLLIFPEGTRRAPGAPPAYKFGVAHLYAELGVPCLPVALNSGLYLAPPQVPAPPRHHSRRVPAADPAGAEQGRLPGAAAGADRDGERPPAGAGTRRTRSARPRSAGRPLTIHGSRLAPGGRTLLTGDIIVLILF